MDGRSLRPVWSYLRRRWINVRRVRFWAVLAVLAYTLLGFFAVPWIAGKVAVDTVREDFGRELSLGAIATNPYTFTVEVTDLALDDADGHRLVAFERLRVNFTLASAFERAWTFQTVQLDGPVVQEERFASGETRFARLLQDAAAEPAEAGEPTEAGEDEMPALTVRDLDVTGGTIRFLDHLSDDAADGGASPAVSTSTIAVRELELSLEDAALHESAGFPVHLGGRLEAGGGFAFDGRVRVTPSFTVDGDLDVDALALGPAEPYLQQIARVALDSGSVSLRGEVAAGPEEPFAYRGRAGVEALSVVPLSGGEPVVGWQSLEIERVDLSLAERRVETSEIVINAPAGRVLIREDQSTNIGELLVDRPAEDADSAGKDDDGSAVPFNINVAGIVLADGDVQFADRSLPLPFSARVHGLSGDISTLASDSAEPAGVQLEGQVGEHGLARVEGAINAWQPMRDTNLTVTFRNLTVADYSPYTVAFAGRRIAGGRMDLDLGYTLANGRLEGRNNIVLRDLELGEKVEHPGAMDLPLGLAVGLLKDSDGVIDMEIPVTGDVGDPQFELGGAIRKALVGAITKVCTSPFRFLAGLIGAGDEDLGRIAFPAGRSDLTPPQRERVALLRKALAERPELVVELAGPFQAEVDSLALKRGQAIEALTEHLREAGREVSSPDLTNESTQDAVEAMFTGLYPEADLDEIRERFTRAPEEAAEGGAGFDAVAYRSHLAERVIAAQTVTNADLAALGGARAAAVRDVLLQEGTTSEGGEAVEPDRIRLDEPEAVEAEEGERVVMEVGLAAD